MNAALTLYQLLKTHIECQVLKFQQVRVGLTSWLSLVYSYVKFMYINAYVRYVRYVFI